MTEASYLLILFLVGVSILIFDRKVTATGSTIDRLALGIFMVAGGISLFWWRYGHGDIVEHCLTNYASLAQTLNTKDFLSFVFIDVCSSLFSDHHPLLYSHQLNLASRHFAGITGLLTDSFAHQLLMMNVMVLTALFLAYVGFRRIVGWPFALGMLIFFACSTYWFYSNSADITIGWVFILNSLFVYLLSLYSHINRRLFYILLFSLSALSHAQDLGYGLYYMAFASFMFSLHVGRNSLRRVILLVIVPVILSQLTAFAVLSYYKSLDFVIQDILFNVFNREGLEGAKVENSQATYQEHGVMHVYARGQVQPADVFRDLLDKTAPAPATSRMHRGMVLLLFVVALLILCRWSGRPREQLLSSSLLIVFLLGNTWPRTMLGIGGAMAIMGALFLLFDLRPRTEKPTGHQAFPEKAFLVIVFHAAGLYAHSLFFPRHVLEETILYTQSQSIMIYGSIFGGLFALAHWIYDAETVPLMSWKSALRCSALFLVFLLCLSTGYQEYQRHLDYSYSKGFSYTSELRDLKYRSLSSATIDIYPQKVAALNHGGSQHIDENRMRQSHLGPLATGSHLCSQSNSPRYWFPDLLICGSDRGETAKYFGDEWRKYCTDPDNCTCSDLAFIFHRRGFPVPFMNKESAIIALQQLL